MITESERRALRWAINNRDQFADDPFVSAFLDRLVQALEKKNGSKIAVAAVSNG